MTMTLKKGFTLIELMIVVAIIGILAAIAIPGFIRVEVRSKQAEVKSNLKAIFTSEKAYFQDSSSFSNLIGVVGFSPERGNRYFYDLGGGGSGVNQSRSTATLGADTIPPSQTGIEADTFKFGATGVAATMPTAFAATVAPGNTGFFTATAAGNVDNDATIDQWSVSSLTRQSATSSDATSSCAAGNNPDGEPCLDRDDVGN